MKPLRIRTERLDLVPAAIAIFEADLEVRKDDSQGRLALARLLAAAVPPSWPPPLLDEAALAEFIRMMSDDSDPCFAAWYWVLDDPAEEGGRVLVGSGGIIPSPTSIDTVYVGYSVLEEFQGRGYATEAVHHMIPGIFAIPGIRKIMATTYPHLTASIRVLEKNGFELVEEAGARTNGGEGIGEGTVVYALKKPCAPRAAGCGCGWYSWGFC